MDLQHLAQYVSKAFLFVDSDSSPWSICCGPRRLKTPATSLASHVTRRHGGTCFFVLPSVLRTSCPAQLPVLVKNARALRGTTRWQLYGAATLLIVGFNGKTCWPGHHHWPFLQTIPVLLNFFLHTICHQAIQHLYKDNSPLHLKRDLSYADSMSRIH